MNLANEKQLRMQSTSQKLNCVIVCVPQVRHARCGFLGETTGNPSFVDLNDVLRKTPGCDSAGRVSLELD